MDIHDVINAVLQGSQAQPGAPLSPVGGSMPQAHSHQKQSGLPTQQGPAQPGMAAGDILGSILSSVLGNHGQTSQGQTNPSQGTPPRVPSGGGLGGQTIPSSPSPSGSSVGGGIPWGDIMGTMLGAGLGSVAANTVLAPIITQLAQRFNIPPRIAQMIVAFAIAQLVQGHMQGGSAQTKNGNFQVHELVNNMCGPGGCSDSYMNQTGMPHELADRTGLDVPTSAKALQYAFNALGTHLNA